MYEINPGWTTSFEKQGIPIYGETPESVPTSPLSCYGGGVREVSRPQKSLAIHFGPEKNRSHEALIVQLEPEINRDWLWKGCAPSRLKQRFEDGSTWFMQTIGPLRATTGAAHNEIRTRLTGLTHEKHPERPKKTAEDHRNPSFHVKFLRKFPSNQRKFS